MLLIIYFFALNRQERQTQSCACPLDRQNLVRNEVSYPARGGGRGKGEAKSPPSPREKWERGISVLGPVYMSNFM